MQLGRCHNTARLPPALPLAEALLFAPRTVATSPEPLVVLVVVLLEVLRIPSILQEHSAGSPAHPATQSNSQLV